MRASDQLSRSVLLCVGALVLAGCSSGPEATPTQPSATSAPTTSTTTPTPTSASGAVATPAECDEVELSPGATVTGVALSACVVAYSLAAGSGHEYLLSGDSTGEVDFVYGDQPQMAGTMTTSDGTTSFVLLPDESWITIDGAWVRGDTASSDPNEVLAGTIGTAYRAAADPAVGASMIAAAPGWTVQTDQDIVSLPDNSQVHAWRLQADAPFTTVGGQVRDMVVWLGHGHAVVGNQATVDVGGILTTTLQQYTDWGAPLDITAPVD